MHESRVPLGPIGPSTGWLSAKMGIALETHARILDRTGATAVEMVCYNRERMRAMLTGTLGPSLQYRALHLPSFQKYAHDQRNLRDELIQLQTLVESHGIGGASAHPDTTPACIYRALHLYGIPFAIENMDRQKTGGKTVEEIRQLGEEHRAPFVLDVQHAYEVGRDAGGDGVDMNERFADMMLTSNGIRHIRASGEIVQPGKPRNIHAQLHVATNRKAILQAIRSVLQRAEHPIPIILEGECLLDIPEAYVPHDDAERQELEARCAGDIRQEIECLTNEIGA